MCIRDRIQISEDAKTWRKIENFPGVPENTYVSDIYASRFDENVVFASFDNTLRDDFKPYLLKSTNKGKTWQSISNNLPTNGAVHTIEQDFVNPDLLFVGTEFGVFVSTNGGEQWNQIKNGLPSIKVKDMVIQKRENDLVIATFGRGFYILDDYSPLRFISKATLDKDAYIFPIKDALMYIPRTDKPGQGTAYYRAPNPEFGATFTYYLKDVPKTLKQIRKEKEKTLFKESKPIPQPTEEEFQAEEKEIPPYLIFTITDESGNVVRKINKSASKGINRVVWDLRYHNPQPLSSQEKFDATKQSGSGTLALPGKYKVSMSIVTRDGLKELVAPVEFNTVVLRNTTLPVEDRNELVAFQKKASELARAIQGANRFLSDLKNRVETIKQAIINTPTA
ncbi:MAG: glycosyl hydrolase, partial [Ignavibacteria bacterium]|nr:glycosyl hydrolase [Ignavibacteria bacterium]